MTDSLIEPDSSIRHGYTQVGDVRLHYAECGAGDRLVLLLHGFPECWYSWRHQLTALGSRFRVVAPDLRGYNLSDKPPRVEDYRVERLVDDVLGLIRHFGAREAAVVGHDWGALVAWAVAQRHPAYVRKLVALQVPPPRVWVANMTWRQAARSWYMLFFQLPSLPEWWLSANDFAAVERMFRTTTRPGTFTDTDIAVYKSALRQPFALTAGLNYYRANSGRLKDGLVNLLRGGGDRDWSSDERIKVPTFFIYGERDMAVVPDTVRGVEEYMDAPYREMRLADANHWVQQEYHAEVSAALMSFLEE
ncbi:MAG TPA: alpha/beta hydrolase [Pyrinomonadaceae bacterium]|nr:alpha/beta hydrolase [Pyrinomonadaceae bacterium]